MAKRKTKQTNDLQKLLWGAVVGLIVVCTALCVLLLGKSDAKNIAQLSPVVSLGAMNYQLVDGKLVERTDTAVKELRTFLNRKAASEGCSAERPAYEQVAAYSKDESQVLLKYGCGEAGAAMFVVKAAGAWKSISPTNQFDIFGIPACDHLIMHTISKDIAPVCVANMETPTPEYRVR